MRVTVARETSVPVMLTVPTLQVAGGQAREVDGPPGVRHTQQRQAEQKGQEHPDHSGRAGDEQLGSGQHGCVDELAQLFPVGAALDPLVGEEKRNPAAGPHGAVSDEGWRSAWSLRAGGGPLAGQRVMRFLTHYVKTEQWY